ncbi:Protein argonaute 4B, partial [Dichanthelium oligosanthes]
LFCLKMGSHDGEVEELPPPPPVPPDVVPIKADDVVPLEVVPPDVVPPDVVPIKADDVVGESPPNKPVKPKRVPMVRPGIGRKGQQILLYSNHFKVSVKSTEDFFFHYHVNLKYEDDRPVDGKGIGRKVIDKLQQTYHSELSNKDFAYDGEKSLFTIGALPQKNNEFTVVMEDTSTGKTAANGNGSPGGNDSPGGGDRKRVRRSYQPKTFKVELIFAAKIPMNAIGQVIRGEESENSLEALRVLDIILRQHSAKQGCLLVRQSFFHNNPSNFVDLGGGVMGCRGFHSSFRGTQSGLSLNIDVSTTMIVKPGPLIDFLIFNQKVDHPSRIDWQKAKRAIKNLRIKTTPANQEFKIVGLSEWTCKEQTFPLKQRNGSNGDCDTVEITVYDYFMKKGIELRYSGDFPCINVGKPKRPTYFPVELCTLVPLQRYTKALSTLQRSSLVEKSRQKPQERMTVLNDALQHSNYDSDPMLRACGISVASKFTQIEGRVLQAPKLKAGNGEDIIPRSGRWNFTNKRMFQTCSVDKWAAVNFSARCDVRSLIRDLIRNASAKGIQMDQPFEVFEESPSMRRAPVSRRVDDMFEQIKSKLPGAPKFLLCLLPERKNCPWKRKCLAEFGIVTQCLAPARVNDPYLLNLLMKINAKLGGLNSLLQIEASPAIPHVSKVPTIILGMDVSHGHPGQSDRPSIAAVVSSRQWPLISKYRASVHTQSPRLEMMSSLFKPRGTEDDGLIRESLIDFYTSSGKRKPDHVIIFRDGVSESQFTQVINIELDQIIEVLHLFCLSLHICLVCHQLLYSPLPGKSPDCTSV